MAKAFRPVNTNTLWAAVGVRTLRRRGLTHVVISAGSRSTPMAAAFAEEAGVQVTVALDERSAGFIALGIAKATHRPAALLCTSGTAVANYLPAVIEARMSATPLLVLSADRPAELRECHSGQTIRQNDLYGSYPVWTTEAAAPSTSPRLLRHWRQTLVDAWQRSQGPLAGPVHLNLPFRDPLTPSEAEPGFKLPVGFDLESFTDLPACPVVHSYVTSFSVAEALPKTPRGVIVAGPQHFEDRDDSAQALLELSLFTGWPILADGASTLRGDLASSGRLISAYDLILRDSGEARALAPEAVVVIGPLPTSKALRTWLEKADAPTLLIGRPGENTDPTHARWSRIDGAIASTGIKLTEQKSAYLTSWRKRQRTARTRLDKLVAGERLFEGGIISRLDQALGMHDRLFVGSSMPIRDLEWFYHPSGPGPEILSNRGANGIDGTVSTALGASLDGRRTVLLCGDLAFLHDSNALLSAYGHPGDLTVVVINNQGGGIFNHLPVAGHARFEQLWGTPQATDLGRLCAAHRVRHDLAEGWASFRRLLEVRGKGVRVIELRTDREADAAWRLRSFRKRTA